MTESIKFGPEWLRNSVANVIAPSPQQQQQQQQQQNQQQHHHQQPNSPSTDSIISRPVLSDHRYGREEMLSLCDKTVRLPEALPRFRRLFVADWQMPLALQPNTDDEQIGSRGLGGTGTPPWSGTHIRPLMPAMGGRGTGIIRGGAIERGRGRGRGLYHGTSYTRSTSLYDEEGRRWLDRNGTDGTTEWSGGSAVSPRKEGFSRGALESWRKGTRDENEEGWRSNSNGTAASNTGPAPRDKWARSTSWRDGSADNGLSTDPDRPNGPSQPSNHQNSSSPSGENGTTNTTNNNNNNSNLINMVNSNSNVPNKPSASYKKSWDDEGNLPEWATESFDYGGTFDATGAFHDSDRVGHDDMDERKIRIVKKQQHAEPPETKQLLKKEEVPPKQPQPQPKPPSKFMDFLDDASKQPRDDKSSDPATSAAAPVQIPNSNTSSTASAPIAHQMDKMVENFVAHLIMDDDASSGSSTQGGKQLPAPLIEWFYRDPQGDTQGPFSSNDMSEWYKAGYFQESLMVRRSIDSTFVPLGHLVKIFGVGRPFISATVDGGPPIPPVIHPEIIDPFRMQRMMNQTAAQPPVTPQQQQPPPQPTPDVNNWSMMTTEQRMFLMQLAHQRPQQPPQPQVDPYNVMKPPQQPTQPTPTQPSSQQQSQPLDLRRLMGGSDFFQSTPPPTVVPPTTQIEPDPIQQLIMQLQIQQKTGGVDAAQQWMKPSQQQQQQPVNVMMPSVSSVNGPMDLTSLGAMQSQSTVNQPGVNQQGPVSVGNSMVQNTSSTHWNATPLPIWEMANSANAQKDQNQQSLQQQHPTLQEVQQQMRQQQQQQQQQQQHHHHHVQQQSEPDILQNGLIDDPSSSMQMQKVESKKKKKESTLKEQQQQQQQLQNAIKEQQQQSKEKQKQKEAEKLKKANEKSKKEEKSTQPAAPAPWVGIQQSMAGTSLTKIQKSEAQRRQIELVAQKERAAEQQKLEIMTKMEIRDVKWNLQMPPAAQVKTLDEIQAEEQNAVEREAAAMAKREKKESTVTVVGDIWNTGAHSMAWQQPKAWSAGQSNAGFWEEPVKTIAAQQQQQKQQQMLSKSQTMATISTAKKQPQMLQQQTLNIQQQHQQMQQKRIEKIDRKRNEKKKDDHNHEFTMWCTRTLSAMNGNVDVPTFVSFLQDIESPFEVKDYIKMYLGETKECTEFAKQFLERRSKQRMQQRQQNAHIDDMCSPAPAINPQANNSSDFQEVKGKNKKIKTKKVMKAVDNRILGFTATSAPDRINVGDRDYGDA